MHDINPTKAADVSDSTLHEVERVPPIEPLDLCPAVLSGDDSF